MQINNLFPFIGILHSESSILSRVGGSFDEFFIRLWKKNLVKWKKKLSFNIRQPRFDNFFRVLTIHCQNVSVRACESAIAHVRAVTSVRKGCEASWNCACEGACVWGYLWPIAHVRSHLNFLTESWNVQSFSKIKKNPKWFCFLFRKKSQVPLIWKNPKLFFSFLLRKKFQVSLRLKT